MAIWRGEAMGDMEEGRATAIWRGEGVSWYYLFVLAQEMPHILFPW